MPYTNLFKNCGYYWGFAAFVSYFVNHPLYTPPNAQISAVLFGLAMLCQLANLRRVHSSALSVWISAALILWEDDGSHNLHTPWHPDKASQQHVHSGRCT